MYTNVLRVKISMVFLFLCFLLLLLSGCSQVKNTNATSVESNKLQPKQVIENYFKYYNEKNRQGVMSTLTSWHNKPNVVFGFENLKSITLISIEDADMRITDGYLKYGRGKENGVKVNNVMSYKVTYQSVYSKDTPPWPNGKDYDYITLIKKDDSSPWLIDDIGKG